MAIKEYFTHPRFTELEPRHQMQFCVIRNTLFFVIGSKSSTERFIKYLLTPPTWWPGLELEVAMFVIVMIWQRRKISFISTINYYIPLETFSLLLYYKKKEVRISFFLLYVDTCVPLLFSLFSRSFFALFCFSFCCFLFFCVFFFCFFSFLVGVKDLVLFFQTTFSFGFSSRSDTFYRHLIRHIFWREDQTNV